MKINITVTYDIINFQMTENISFSVLPADLGVSHEVIIRRPHIHRTCSPTVKRSFLQMVLAMRYPGDLNGQLFTSRGNSSTSLALT